MFFLELLAADISDVDNTSIKMANTLASPWNYYTMIPMATGLTLRETRTDARANFMKGMRRIFAAAMLSLGRSITAVPKWQPQVRRLQPARGSEH